MLNFTYNGVPFQGIGTGYRVACAHNPTGELIDDEFYVYVAIQRKLESDDSMKLESIGPVPKATLSLEGAGIAKQGIRHQFKDIGLRSVLFRGTHLLKERVLEFQYNATNLSALGDDGVTLESDYTNTCEGQRLGHTLSVGDREDRLLGVAYRPVAKGNTVLQVSWYANDKKSILGEVFKRRGGWKKQLTLTLGDNEIEVTSQNLDRVVVEQTWGSMSQETPRPYLDLLKAEDPARLHSFGGSAAATVLQHERGDAGDEKKSGIHGGAVETATLIFQDGHFNDLELS